MNQSFTKSTRGMAAAVFGTLAVCLMATATQAEPPRVAQADLDYEASGLVLPAGETAFDPGRVQQAMMTTPAVASQMAVSSPTAVSSPSAAGSPMMGSPVMGSPMMGSPLMGPNGTGVSQVGFFDRGCDAAPCDAAPFAAGSYAGGSCAGDGYGGMSCGGMGCGTAGCGSCQGGFLQRRMAARQARFAAPCEPVLSGGLLGKLNGNCGMAGDCGVGATCGIAGCDAAGTPLSSLRHLCMFCRGNGCSACQLFNPAAFTSILHYLKPYTEGGLCNQRWYDVSAGAIFLGRTTRGIGSNVVTQRGAGGFGTPVLFGGDGVEGDLEAGVRLSAAMIFGPGGNVELTYMGGQEWNSSASVTAPANLVANPDPGTAGAFPFVIASGADLFSFISDFGTDPIGGFDDTDRSISQTIDASADFHSGEINYRRRTVGPYCRFQGSWLMGLRYLRYDESLGLSMVGLNNDGTDATLTDGTLRFFNANNSVKNEMFGVQIGGDLWWNMMPGVSFGIDGKLAWLKNEASGGLNISSNSIVAGGPGSVAQSISTDDGTLAGEFQAKMLYRLTRDWAFRGAYYLIAVDDVASSGLDGTAIRSAIDTGSLPDGGLNFDSLVLNGFSVGAEYTW